MSQNGMMAMMMQLHLQFVSVIESESENLASLLLSANVPYIPAHKSKTFGHFFALRSQGVDLYAGV